MMYKVMIAAAVLAVCLVVTPALADGESNAEQVNPEVTKLIDRLTADVDALTAKLPEDATDDDKARLTEEFDLLKSFIKAKLVPLCTNRVFAKEVAGQNAKGTSLDEIQAIDEQWKNAEEELPIHVEMMGNDCAKEIAKIVKQLPVLGETFVMDNQGANVGQNALTSDYWQGDEAKWKNSYKEAKGGVDVERPEAGQIHQRRGPEGFPADHRRGRQGHRRGVLRCQSRGAQAGDAGRQCEVTVLFARRIGSNARGEFGHDMS